MSSTSSPMSSPMSNPDDSGLSDSGLSDSGRDDRPTNAAAQVVLAEVRDTPLSVDELLEAVRDRRAGAVVAFIGLVRDHDHGESVEVLDYECHPSAADVARALADRLAADGRALKLGVVHRYGHLEVGDLAVVVAVSSAHRAEAFEVARELIDEFKATVPIWKRQTFTDGSDEWVGLP